MVDRFVILHHVQSHGEHWDLMLEQGDVLLTWQLESEPIHRRCLPIRARRIGDHRKAYLTYEGPLSDGRGSVRRVASGAVSFLAASPSRFDLKLDSDRLSGRFVLEVVEDEWVFREAENV